MIFLAFIAQITAQSCSALSCAQCNSGDSVAFNCAWCPSNNATGAGSCIDSTANCSMATSSYDSGLADCGTPSVFNTCENLGCTACTANTACSFCGQVDEYTSYINLTDVNYGLCVMGANACPNNTITSTQCTAFAQETTSICESLTCGQCNTLEQCTWCGGASNGMCVTDVCPSNLPVVNSFDATTCPAATTCEAITDCTACNANSACSFCASADGFYGLCVTGKGACTHNDSASTAAACAAYTAATTTVCDSFDCTQCLGAPGSNNFCNWCFSNTTSTGKCSTLPCTVAMPAAFTYDTCAKLSPSACDGLNCTACAANAACSSCGNMFGYQACVQGVHVCPDDDAANSTAACQAVAQSLVTVCEALSCHECFSDQGQECSWCGTKCVSGGFCDNGLPAANVSACATAPASTCEKLSCTACTANSACSFCASPDDGYAFCVDGKNACNSNDTILSTGCAALPAVTSICDSLSCSQCVNGAVGFCNYCNNAGTSSCSSTLCDNPIFDSSTCAAPGPCESLSCSACQANSACSYCASYDSFGDGYGVCVTGAGKCTNNDTVAVGGCATLPLDPCPLLSCTQCTNDPTGTCSWCGSSCTSLSCASGVTEIFDASMCPTSAAASPCSNITDCGTCFKTSGCQFCADKNLGIAVCVAGTSSAVCQSAAVTSADQCTNATGQATVAPAKTPLPPGASRTVATTVIGTPKPAAGTTMTTTSTTKAAGTTGASKNAAGNDVALLTLSALVALIAAALTF